MKLIRQSGIYNPFFMALNSNENVCTSEVNEIKIYDPETQQVLAYSRWFGSNNNYKVLELCPNVEPKRKLKEDLTSKVPFYMSHKETYSVGPQINIYIPVGLLDGFSIDHRVSCGHDELFDRFYDMAQFKANARKRKYDRVNGEIVSSYPEEMQEEVVKFDFNHVWEKTTLCKRYEKLANAATEAGVKLSYYDLQKLASVWNITEKRNK